MTSLKCSAHNCCYNKNSLCSRGAISVEGADARYARMTPPVKASVTRKSAL